MFQRFAASTILVLTLSGPLAYAVESPLPETLPLDWEGDLALRMVNALHEFLDRELAATTAGREEKWRRNYSSSDAYTRSVAPNRERLTRLIGAVDPRVPTPELELISTTRQPSRIAGNDTYTVDAVRWPVFDGVWAEGLLLEPTAQPTGQVVALPDADWTPEMIAGLSSGLRLTSQFARRLAENGCRVLVPTLIDRLDTWSGNPRMRMTNQPHREYIYRMAFEEGRHMIGYEVQKVLAAVDWFTRHGDDVPIGVAGYGEGGLIALYSAAVDPRIDAALVSGYFQPREKLAEEPIYRNLWAFLTEFGDAELAGLIAPRPLIIEASRGPLVNGPPPPRNGRTGGAPGRLAPAPLELVQAEVERARPIYERLGAADDLKLTSTDWPGAEETLAAFLGALGRGGPLEPSQTPLPESRTGFDPRARMKRQFEQLVDFTQRLVLNSEQRRRDFWSKVKPTTAERWSRDCQWYRDYYWDEIIGRFDPPSGPLNPRSRQIMDEPRYTGYEVVLDVWPEVFAYGILLVPKGMQPDERRPVVVCQHGLEGRPQDTVLPEIKPIYNTFAAKLADRGFITFSPQCPYIFQDHFRSLQRKAHPLKRSLFGIIVRQHERILEWLGAQPFVDASRIALYGISYGGKTAMRVPALLPQYALAICSADFNEWNLKMAWTDYPNSYMFTNEYEMFQFDLGSTFNYLDMAALIAPRPLMVERGHDDPVAPDEWVAFEYAKVRRLYTKLGVPEQTAIEYFDGGHKINGVGTFEFLEKHLNWPPRE